MVKAIIFDCFGVLTTDYWKEFAATLLPEQLEPARELLYRYDAGRIDRDEFMSAVKKLTDREPRAVEELLQSEMSKNVGLLNYIKELKANYKIGLLSNIGSGWIRDSFLSHDEKKLFNDMVFSYEVGLAKPDPEIFELAAERLGVAAADCVMVDDSEGHCRAATKAGMHMILYENLEQLKRELQPLLSQS